MPNIVFIGASLDGYIADRNEGLDFLQCVPNPDGDDLGFISFMERIDAIVMGRKTYEMVVGFGGPWPYSKPVYVLSSTLTEVPVHLAGRVHLINAPLKDIVKELNGKGLEKLYIDGGQVVQGFLREDLIDEMIITRIPILLGGGVPLFADLPAHYRFSHVSTEVLLDELVSSRYVRER